MNDNRRFSMQRGAFIFVLAGMLATGCGGPGSVDGTVFGRSLAVADSTFQVILDDNAREIGLYILLSNIAGQCESIAANRLPKGETFLGMTVRRKTLVSDAVAPTAGTYPIGERETTIGSATFVPTDSNCESRLQDQESEAVSGFIKLDQLSTSRGGLATGSFDLTVGLQKDRITGSFSSVLCSASLSNPSCE